MVLDQDSGVMLHFMNERLVDGEEAMHSSVIHVHKLCIDWYVILTMVEDTIASL